MYISNQQSVFIKNALDSSRLVYHLVGTGHHGYNPSQDTDLYPLFIASGPAFKKGIVSEPIHIVDLYPLMCEVLGIEPAPNNGSLERARHLLIDQSGSNSSRSTITGLGWYK